jgi:hypothetical protein
MQKRITRRYKDNTLPYGATLRSGQCLWISQHGSNRRVWTTHLSILAIVLHYKIYDIDLLIFDACVVLIMKKRIVHICYLTHFVSNVVLLLVVSSSFWC